MRVTLVVFSLVLTYMFSWVRYVSVAVLAGFGGYVGWTSLRVLNSCRE